MQHAELVNLSTRGIPSANVRVLGIDAASVRTGYAMYAGPREQADIWDAGYISAGRSDVAPLVRIWGMCLEFEKLVAEFRPAIVCIEVTSGKVGSNRHKGGGAGLGTYGMGVGAMWHCMQICADEYEYRPWHVTENDWTGGRTKDARRQEVKTLLPRYADKLARDPGGDVCDAIGICWWAYAQLRARLAMERRA